MLGGMGLQMKKFPMIPRCSNLISTDDQLLITVVLEELIREFQATAP